MRGDGAVKKEQASRLFGCGLRHLRCHIFRLFCLVWHREAGGRNGSMPGIKVPAQVEIVAVSARLAGSAAGGMRSAAPRM